MDALCRQLRRSLPEEIVTLTQKYLENLETGEFESLLNSEEARKLLDSGKNEQTDDSDLGRTWQGALSQRLENVLKDSTLETRVIYFCIGYAALLAFLQSNVTGPPLPFSSPKVFFSNAISSKLGKVREVRQALLGILSLDGIAAYKLTPNVELLCLAKAILTNSTILEKIGVAKWAKVRVNFMHQRLLSEPSPTLQNSIDDDLDAVVDYLQAEIGKGSMDPEVQAEFLLERSTIYIHHGLDKQAQADIDQATRVRQFQFAITGLLGKRTKFQQRDISQLVVLARSAEQAKDLNGELVTSTAKAKAPVNANQPSKPENLDLNDDTLLESISFTEKPNTSTKIQDSSTLPPALVELDPSNQPKLEPLDSSILLSLASSITNTSPEDGLIREETLPYATRVLEGGSSNWQVYTQALLVRSRIEGYKSRTIERGLLQLQALVDQVIADTTSADISDSAESADNVATSFLPKAKGSENASAPERLRYIFQLASPTRWDLEAELAARWVQLGGLRSALDIYERLEMWAEAALCWAATEREDKAKRVVRSQLFHASAGVTVSDAEVDNDEETWEGPARDPAPLDAPRLYCILGDIDASPQMWERAWEVSGQRYARAQRSLGRYYIASRDYVKAASAYSKSLSVAQLHVQSWFALGCALLELDAFERAVQAFTRCVQLDESDAEAWSNLAAALLRTDPEAQAIANAEDAPAEPVLDDEEKPQVDVAVDAKQAAQNTRLDALKALKRAAALKHDSHRIWENVLTVAAACMPPDFATVLAAQRRIIQLRGSVEGESCIDVTILQALVSYVISSADWYDPAQPGLVRMVVKFLDEGVVPLITSSAELWRLVSKLALWRRKPTSALEAEEKGWRAVSARPGWETESEGRWNEVVEATVRLCDSYESLGQMERTEGMGAGELVAKDWKFKARSAIRGIMGRGKDSWQDTEGWERLRETADNLKG